ncbi:MAG: AAA family ATPase [Thermorudis peleae]|nr:AAA family ATPase [Thermorudis peleae]
MIDVTAILQALTCGNPRCECQRAIRRGQGKTHCPCHADNKPSLNVTTARDGTILLKCFGGCRNRDVIRELQDRGLWPRREPARETRYEIHDVDGTLVAVHVRIDRPGREKQMWWEQPDGRRGLNGRRVEDLPLYGIERLGDAEQVIVTEGEKAADALLTLGIPAVGTVTGASAIPSPESLKPLAVRLVWLWPDNDDQGRHHMHRLAERLSALGCQHIWVIDWPDAPPGGDAYDFVARGGVAEDVLRLMAKAEQWQSRFSEFSSRSSPSISGRAGRESETGQDSASGQGDFSSRDTEDGAESAGRESGAFRLTALGDLLAEPEEQIDWLVQDMLPSGGISLLGAKPKVGKSTTARCLALAVARGEPFLGRETAQGPVVYLALEEKRAEIAKHFRRLGAGNGDPVYIHVGMAPERALEALASAIETHKPALVIIDPLLKLVRVRDANDYAEVTRALEPVIELARQSGAHLMLIHHLSKGERNGGDAILGSTALFGAVDTAILMRRNPIDGTRTIETIQRYGEDMPESVIALDEQTGTLTLAGTVAERKQAEAEAAILEALSDEPLTEPEIRDAVEMKGIVVSRALRSLVEQGVLQRTGTGRRGDPYRYQKFSSRSSQDISGRAGRESENGQDPASGREEFSSQGYRPDADTAGREFAETHRPAVRSNGAAPRCCCGGVLEPSEHDGWLRCDRCRQYVRPDDPALRR